MNTVSLHVRTLLWYTVHMLSKHTDQIDLVSKALTVSNSTYLACPPAAPVFTRKNSTENWFFLSLFQTQPSYVRSLQEPANNHVLSLSRLGWGVLCVAGGGAYYFAKKSVNADRASRYEADMKQKARIQGLEPVAPTDSDSSSKSSRSKKKNDGWVEEDHDYAGRPSVEAGEDVASVGHSPQMDQARTSVKSKYEAAEPYRSRKGNRLS